MPGRDHFRAQGRLRVHIDGMLREQDGVVRPVTIRNLGFAGAGVETSDPILRSSTQAVSTPLDLSIGRPVSLEIVAPMLWDPLVLLGTVAWTDPNSSSTKPIRVGIHFESLQATTRLSLFDILCAYEERTRP